MSTNGPMLAQEMKLDARRYAKALFETADEISKLNAQSFSAHAKEKFDRAKPLTLKSFRIKYARKNKGISSVRMIDELSKGTPPNKYLAAQIEGGIRRPKSFEKLLQRMFTADGQHILSPGQDAIEIKALQNRKDLLDRYGNLKGSQYVSMLSYLGAMRESGYRANATAESRKRRRKATKKRNGISWYVVPNKGVFRRIHKFGGGSESHMVLKFIPKHNYKVKLPIEELSERNFKNHATRIFEEQVARQIARQIQAKIR